MYDSKLPFTPSLDAVFVWVSFTIERDLVERGALPELRSDRAVVQHGSTSLHIMSAEAVQPVLEDARIRRDQTRKGLRHAYNAFVGGIEAAIKEATQRRAIFEAPEPVRTYRSEYSEVWRGTKEQLQAMGIKLSGPWPGEIGGKQRRAKAYDTKGRAAYITAYSRTWSGLFEAQIQFPECERQQAKNADELAKKRAKAEAVLDDMPHTVEEYRLHLAQDVRRWLSVIIRSEPVDWHGFTVSADALDDILLSADAVVEAIMEAEVKFDQTRHREIVTKYKQQIAETDAPFQQMLGALTTVDPSILGGKES